MPTATTSLPLDLPSQWVALSDDELSLDNIQHVLKPIRDDLWVSAACLDRILDDAVVQQSLLDLGLERTEAASIRAQSAASRIAERLSEGEDEQSKEDKELGPGPEDQTRHASLVSYFSDDVTDAQLCRMRMVLLERLDRLNSFVEICKEAPVADESEEDTIDEEWEDDPWADTAGESSTATKCKSSGKPPIPLSTLLASDLVESACVLASQEHFIALRILVERHSSTLWPYRFDILGCIPEYSLASEYRDLLPPYDLSADAELRPPPKPWRKVPDFTETLDCIQALDGSGVALSIHLPSNPFAMHPQSESLNSSELSSWYFRRIDYVLSSTGMVDAALALIQHAASQGVPGLDEAGEDLTLIARLVYDAPQAVDGAAEDWSLSRWRSMSPAEIVHAYLAHTTEERVARDVHRLVMPYLFVLESRAERAGKPDAALATRILHHYVLEAPLGIVAAIFEASKPTLPQSQRVIRDDEDMARLALACLYGSDCIDEWPTMSRIFECLPAWETPEEDTDEADEADTTIASLGAFVTPSTARPRATPSDLLIFFKPLPITSLSRALDVLDVHLESGEILARWSVPAPLRWFLQSNANIAEQRARANRMARRANASDDKLETQEDWEWLLEDMLKLSDSGESGSRSAFCLLSRDDIIRIFFSGLLSTGSFDIAKKLLRSSSVQLSLDPQVIEDICLTCSQEFYDNATSGNYHFGDMKLAYDCLDVPASSDRVVQEKEFIEATSRLCSFNLMSRPGIPISPIEIRLTKDRLSLVSRVLSSNNDAYKHTQVILDLVHKLGFRDDVVAEVKTLAMLAETALQASDFVRAYETSETMVNTVLLLRGIDALGPAATRVEAASEVCWLTCFQLGRHPEFPDTQKKLTLLGRALEFCPAERLPDVLASWRPIEEEDIDRRRELLAARKRGARRVSAPRQRTTRGADAIPLASRLQNMHMPDLHIPHSPDAATLANKAFSSVAANIPFSFGGRGRSYVSEEADRSRSGSRGRVDGAHVVSEQASRVLQKGIGWLLGADDEM